MKIKFLQDGVFSVYVHHGQDCGGPPATSWKPSAKQFRKGDVQEYPGAHQGYALDLISQGLAVGVEDE